MQNVMKGEIKKIECGIFGYYYLICDDNKCYEIRNYNKIEKIEELIGKKIIVKVTGIVKNEIRPYEYKEIADVEILCFEPEVPDINKEYS